MCTSAPMCMYSLVYIYMYLCITYKPVFLTTLVVALVILIMVAETAVHAIAVLEIIAEMFSIACVILSASSFICTMKTANSWLSLKLP